MSFFRPKGAAVGGGDGDSEVAAAVATNNAVTPVVLTPAAAEVLRNAEGAAAAVATNTDISPAAVAPPAAVVPPAGPAVAPPAVPEESECKHTPGVCSFC